MATWNDLNASQPADTEAVSNGASRIRAVVDAGKTTWDVEHNQTGEHNFPVAQPGAPLSGQIWFDLVNRILRRYDGVDHSILSAVGLFYTPGAAIPGATISLNATYQDIQSVSGVVVPANARVLLVSMLNLVFATDSQVFHRFVRDATSVDNERTVSAITTTGEDRIVTALGVDLTPAAGTYSYKIQGRISSGAVVGLTTTSILALVL